MNGSELFKLNLTQSERELEHELFNKIKAFNKIFGSETMIYIMHYCRKNNEIYYVVYLQPIKIENETITKNGEFYSFINTMNEIIDNLNYLINFKRDFSDISFLEIMKNYFL